MTQAVMLADRNKQLEKELHDIDQLALAVEAECNSTVQENTMRVSKIQVRRQFSMENPMQIWRQKTQANACDFYFGRCMV
jgi:centrosomal protein CEP135